MALSILDRTHDEGDPIDLQLHRLGASPAPARSLPWYMRWGLGWSRGAPPVLLLLIVGAALGPTGLALLTPGVLTALDPVVPVALAALGVHAALHMPLGRTAAGARIAGAALVESLITMAVVATGVVLVIAPGTGPAPYHAWLMAFGAAVCAAVSAPVPLSARLTAAGDGARQNLDVLVAVVFGGVLLAWVREGTMAGALLILTQTAVLPLIVAVAAWLLLGGSAPEAERRIFMLAALLLLGGLADFLSLSALLSGLIAGLFWRALGGPTLEVVQRDIGYLQHPLVALLLVVGGARMTMVATAGALVVAYVLLRAAGKLAGGVVARPLWRRYVPHGAELALLRPGVYGVAIALATVRAAGPQVEGLLGVVVLATVVTQLLSAMTTAPERA